MSLILHISDLHLGKNEMEETKRISSLAESIINEKLTIKHVVFTGDIIDARSIVILALKKLISEYPDVFARIETSKLSEMLDEVLKLVESEDMEIVEKYNEYLKEIAIASARTAAKIINIFLKKIGVERHRFISCCGNHDRLRFLGKENTFNCGDNRQIDEMSLGEEYLPYREFCKETNYNLTYQSQDYNCDGIHYIIANSNWKTPENRETNNACINCTKLSSIIYTREKADDYKKEKTIFISHKPFDDICENAKYTYHENDYSITVKEHVKRATTMSLHGDKHSYIIDVKDSHSEFMCGLPLCNNGVHYNIIDYSEEGGASFARFMIYDNNHWILIPTADCVDETYALCKHFIKGFAMQLISKEKIIPKSCKELFRTTDKSFNDGRFDLIRTLFRECATVYDSKQNKLPYKDNNIFEDIFQLINLSTERRILGLKGEPGTGKSTFLSVQYIYMLRKFYNGDTKYIPFYVDIDAWTKEMLSSVEVISDIQKVIDWYCVKFSEYLAQVINICCKYKLRPCIIIDGLDCNNMLTYAGHTIEHFYYQMLEERLKSIDGKYIMGLNTHLNSHAEKSFEHANKFQYACFLNKVFIVPYKDRDHYTNFIVAYLKLKRDSDDKEIDIFYEILKKLRRISVDLDYIHGLDELLKDDIGEADSWKIMRRKLELTSKRVDETFGETHKEVLYKAAYLLAFRGYTYQYILNDNTMKDLTYGDFLKIRNNPEVTKFLIARHYLQELKYYAFCDEGIDEESILNCFISRDISVIIRLLIEDLGIQAQVFKDVVSKHSNDMQAYFTSFLMYLLGHNKKYKGLDAIKTNHLKLHDENKFLDNCLLRSKELAEIVSADDDGQQLKSNEYILKLMSDESYRLFNRIYQLWYYEDIKDPVEGKRGTQELTKKIGKGFDFHNCFMFMVSKIDYCFANNDPYPLLEVDMFTMCDFIYSRLQNFSPEAMFYSMDYNTKGNSVSASVLRRMIDIISKYSNNLGQSRNLSSSIHVYFEMVRNVFQNSLDKIEKMQGMCIDEPFVSQALDYAKVVNLCEMPRVGWNITKTETVYKKNMPKYENIQDIRKQKYKKGNTIFETIGQHILESVYIAELFLPAHIKEEGYEKSKVISMILMSEVGKIAIGYDYTPDYSQASKILMPKENNGRKQFLVKGSFDGYADFMNLYDAMLILGGELTAYADINMRICQEIKLIQMEYKFYTLREQLGFETAREIDFKHEFVDLITPICKDIRKMLITNNTDFRKDFN